MRRTKARISSCVGGRPTRPTRGFHLQKHRNPRRCQRTTVSGWTRIRALLQRGHIRRSTIQKSRSAAGSRRRGRRAARTASCRRRAGFSSRRSAREANREWAQRARTARHRSIRGRCLPAQGRSTPSTCPRLRAWPASRYAVGFQPRGSSGEGQWGAGRGVAWAPCVCEFLLLFMFRWSALTSSGSAPRWRTRRSTAGGNLR